MNPTPDRDLEGTQTLSGVVGELAKLRQTHLEWTPGLGEKLEAIAGAVRALVAQRETPKAWAWQAPKHRLNDIGGLPADVHAEIGEVVARCRDWRQFESLKIPKPIGVALIGPSGVGKTMLAHALAHELGLDKICVVSGPSLLNSLTEFDRLFVESLDYAREKGQAVVFLDELEVLGEHRHGTRLSGIDALKHLFIVKLMTKLEELQDRHVLVVGATNRIDMLDPALLRLGRFERSLYLDLPTPEARYDILSRLQGTRKVKVSHKLLRAIAESTGRDTGTSGFSGADLADVLVEAQVWASLHRGSAVDEAALHEGIRRVRVQVSRRSANDPENIFTRSLVPLAPLPPPHLGLARVVGLARAKEQMEVIVKMLADPERFKRTDCRLPRGVLLSGPPGVGKTLLARSVAEETNANFFYLAASDFEEMYVGVGAARVRDTFRIARNQSPSILFIDEIDALGTRRGSGTRGDSEQNKTLNEILTCMSGVDDERGVIVIGATNRPALLDPALVRPGRFDFHVSIPYPTPDERKAIWKHYIPKKHDLTEETQTRVLEDPRVLTGAAIASLLNTAMVLAAVDGKDVADEHLAKALEWTSPVDFEEPVGPEDLEY